MADRLAKLFDDIDAIYAEPAKDYRGRDVGADHVRRYLTHSFHRTLEMYDILSSPPPGRVLDIGVGYGFYDVLLREDGADVTGLELPENIPVYCKLLEARGIPVLAGRLGDLPADLEPGSFDTVVLSEVFEHLRITPLRALREIGRLLRPGGHVILTTPNIARWSNVARLFLGRNILEKLSDDESLDHVTDAIQHIREYTLDELVELTERAGLRLVTARHSLAKDLPRPGKWGGLQRGAEHATRAALAVLPRRWRGLLLIVAERGPSPGGA